MIKIKIAIVFLLTTGASSFIASESASQTRGKTNDSSKAAKNSSVAVAASQTKCNVEAYRVGFAGETPVVTNVRAKPDKNAELLKTITVMDQIVFYISGSDGKGWFEVSKIETTGGDVDETLFSGRGWVHSSTLDLSVAGGTHKLYAAPQKKSRALKKLIPDASPARPIACKGDWMQVKSGKLTGWLAPESQCASPLTTCN